MKQKILLMVAAFLSGALFMNVTAAEEVTTGGTIKFAQKLENGEPGGQQCTLPITPGSRARSYNFRTDDASCGNDVVSFFRVENAPSAVLFELRSDAPANDKGKCRSDSETRWIFRLRTTQQKTTSGWISIPGLRGRPDKDIVDAGGVRLESQKDDGGNIEGKLSCVKIDY